MRTVTRPTRQKTEIKEWIETLVGAVVLAALIMLFIGRAFAVDGPSMLPTLHDGEKILVDKVTYRFRDPGRGDIVVFRYPGDLSEHYIKRIIGVPGDVIEIKNGQVILNGHILREDYLSEPVYYSYGPYSVPNESYFVLGDNRNNSKDSRSSDVGFVPRNLIVGRALWRYWPLSTISVLRAPAVFETVAAQAPN